MADFSTSESELWWLRQDKPESAVPALALGARIAEHKMDAMRQAEQFKTGTAIRMMDLMMEQQRNGIALKTFQNKQNADLLRAEGMAEIGNYLGDAIKNNRLTDPEAQAGFWKLTSRYAPFIDERTVNSIWDNNFGAAMNRQDKARGLSSDSTAAIKNWNQLEQLKSIVENAPDEESRSRAQKSLDEFRHTAGVMDTSAEIEIKDMVMPDGSTRSYYLGRKGEPVWLKEYDPTKITDKLKLARFTSAIRSYDKLWESYDPLILSADGKSRDPQKLIALKDKAYEAAVPGGNKIDTTPPKGVGPSTLKPRQGGGYDFVPVK